jgi:hypothetical protein
MAALCGCKIAACFLTFTGLLWTTNAAFTDFEDYLAQYAAERPEHSLRLLPFGVKYHDNELTSSTLGDPSVDLAINFNIPFFGRHYDEIHMSIHGFASLGEEALYYLKSTQLPNIDFGVEGEMDPPMIAPYFAHHKLDNAGAMYSRVVDPSVGTDIEKEIAQGMLDTIYREVRWHVMGGRHALFTPTHAVILTWLDVPFFICFEPPCPTNTYQAIIVTDQKKTYTIFNYYETVWENGPSEKCSSLGLTDAEHQTCFSAQAGFNAGQGREFYSLPYSNTPDVIRLDTIGGTDGKPQPGKFIYEVDGMHIHRGGCVRQNISPEFPILPEVTPQSGPMMGGFEIHISGSCLDLGDSVKCRFGSQDGEFVDGFVVDELRAACLVPTLTQTGEVPVYVYLRGGTTPTYTVSLHIEHPEKWRNPVVLVDYADWMNIDAEQLSLTWNPELLERPSYSDSLPENNTIPEDLSVDITLFGYKEQEVDGVMEIEWRKLHILAEDISNSGSFAFSPINHRCMEEADGDCDWHVGSIKVSTRHTIDTLPEFSRGMWSRPTPIAWHVNDALESAFGEDWGFAKCKAWKEETAVADWIPELQPCPCTFAQAYTDLSGYILGADCEPGTPCPLQPSAAACFVSTKPTPSGAASRCCYNTEGNLLYSGDSTEGSFSETTHPDGIHPYGVSGKIPSLSNWIFDKLPFLWCCKWAVDKSECLDQFMAKRPTPPCLQHEKPAHATAYGDPHLITFDGYEYTFNGRGEFVLLSAENPEQNAAINVQARMESPGFLEAEGEIKATIITAVSMTAAALGGNHGDVPTVDIHLNPSNSPQRLSVYVNGEYQDFYSQDIYSKEYFGTGEKANVRAVIRKNPPIEPMSGPNNFTVTYSNGVAVTVAQVNGVMHITASIPMIFYEKTSGLFGKYNDDMADDLYTRTGERVESLTPQDIYQNFGKDWQVTAAESIFTYMAKMDHAYFQDATFLPNFDPEFPNVPGINITEADIQRECGENFMCRFDYMATLNAAVGGASMEAQSWAMQLNTMSEPVVTCGRPEVSNGVMTVTHYLAGGEVEFTGCIHGYILQGEGQYMCSQNGEWQPEMDTRCKSQADIDKEKATLAAAIAVPITLLVLVALIGLAVFFVWKRKKDGESDDNKDSPPRKDPQMHAVHGLSRYPEPEEGSASRSQSTSSVGSVILTEDIHRQRPARPKENKQKLQRPDQNANGQVSYDNRAASMENLQQQPPATGYVPYGRPVYDNVAADISAEDHGSRPPPVPTIPPPPEEGYDNEAIDADSAYPPRGLYKGGYNPGSDTAV